MGKWVERYKEEYMSKDIKGIKCILDEDSDGKKIWLGHVGSFVLRKQDLLEMIDLIDGNPCWGVKNLDNETYWNGVTFGHEDHILLYDHWRSVEVINALTLIFPTSNLTLIEEVA